MTGKSVSIVWQGRRVQAWLPDALTSFDLHLPSEVVRKTERAVAAIRVAHEHLPVAWEPLARLLLRAEGVASSYIEGVRAPLARIAGAELDPEAIGGAAAWVADNLSVVDASVADARKGRLSVATLHRWHKRLMRHGTLPRRFVGRFRTAQGWIGGTSPLDAVFVPPPPEAVGPLMDDLVSFCNGDEVDAVTQAAVAHAQFETIHPYGDGNGRIGRVLVGWLIVRREMVSVPPPISVLIARDPGGYLAGLQLFRQGALADWVGWFADVVHASADATVELVDDVEALLDGWRSAVDDLRADAGALRALELLPENPVLSAAHVADRLAVSERSARNALDTLTRRGIVRRFPLDPDGPGRPPVWWVAQDIVDAIGKW